MEDETVDSGASIPSQIRVFLLDDHEVVRRGVRELLETHDDIIVVGEAGSAAEARNRIPGAAPDVAVLDVQLGDGTGIEVCRDVRSANPVKATTSANTTVTRSFTPPNGRELSPFAAASAASSGM